VDYDKELVEKGCVHWYELGEILGHLRRKTRYQPIGFELLPEKFTIPQLQ
jgi:hypothetical protein